MEKKLKKIMFNDKYGLTKTVLENRKTQTRRAIKLKDGEYVKVVALDNGSFMSYVAKDGKPTAYVGALEMPNFVRVLAPKYFIGEEVAIAQKYSECHRAVCFVDTAGWNNKMFVNPYIMPHRIKITNIRIERLQDISNEDCLKEGIGRRGDTPLEFFVYGEDDVLHDTPQRAFSALIDNVSGKGTWQSNPYVFVYDFELIR